MRRTGTIVAPGTLLSRLRGAVTASPTLAAERGSRFRRLLAGIAGPALVMGALAGGALGAPALAATGARPLHITALQIQFLPGSCLNPSCSLVRQPVVGKATSNLSTGAGSFQANLTVDFSPGGTCNIVDEPVVWTFDKWTISTHSHHEDCATSGLRINTTFHVTGGTGAFAGATGGGREFASAANAAPIIYNGTISF